jgi:2-oxoglutarate dehydrogenase E1 component
MEVVYPSTGAQIFHLLRRQALRDFRKPLIVMTPKKFLRIETSSIEELSRGEFQHVIDDPSMQPKDAPKAVTRVVYCTGKIYHELAERREKSGRKDVALVRIEQLYPFHHELANSIDQRYPASAVRTWAQEEPRNMGAFLHIADLFRERLGKSLEYVGRPASASPATASEYTHKDQQTAIGDRVFGASPDSTAANGLAQLKPANRAASLKH